MSETNLLDSESIDIPTPDEVINKIKFKKEADFFKKANCQIRKKIITFICERLTLKKNIFLIGISEKINYSYAFKFIELVVKPMFEEKGWIVTVKNGNNVKMFCNIYWSTAFFSNNFVINSTSTFSNYNYISIQLNSCK